LLLFFRANSLRVVVATANLTKGGWCGTRNHLWQQDFPVRAATAADADAADATAADADNADAADADAGAWRRLMPDGGFASELACLVASLLARCDPAPEEAALVARLSR